MDIYNNKIILANAINSVLEQTMYGGTILFLDIDYTTFTNNTNIYIEDENDNIVDTTDSVGFNTYKLYPGHKYNFKDFRSTDKFIETAQPIETTVKEINKILNRHKLIHGLDKIVFITARANMDDKDKFLKFFEEKLNLPMYDQSFVRIERAGNSNQGSIADRKRTIMTKELNTGKYRNAIFLDDDKHNLDAFLSLDNEYQDINFIALLVTTDFKLQRQY